MSLSKGQGEIFNNVDYLLDIDNGEKELTLKKELLEDWQNRINHYQRRLFETNKYQPIQESLFKNSLENPSDQIDPLKLTPLPLNFWRWSKTPHQGAAIYFVMDYLSCCKSHILLYIGETSAADQRWKGEHDCKNYLESYAESIHKAGLDIQLSIRFWTDVPKDTRQRRKLEMELIKKWLPPFNKETRKRWATPFTCTIN